MDHCEYYLYNHSLDEIDSLINYKHFKKQYIERDVKTKKILAGHGCEKCGITLLGEWNYRTYKIPMYYDGKYQCKNIWETNLGYKKGMTESQINKALTVSEETTDDIREDLKVTTNVLNLLSQYNQEISDFVEMKACPICGEEYPVGKSEEAIIGDSWWWRKSFQSCLKTENSFYGDLDTIFGVGYQIRAHLRNKFDGIYRKRSEVKLAAFTQKMEGMAVEPVDTVVLNDAETLKKFLHHITTIEKAIYLIRSRLSDLYLVEIEKENEALASKVFSCRQEKIRLEEIKKLYESRTNQQPEIIIDEASFDVEKPTAPAKPEKPALQKAGLFNKKKVDAENEALIKEYERHYAEYEELCIKYKVALEAYYKKEEAFKREQEIKRQLEIKRLEEEHQKECEALKAEYDKLLVQYENSINSSESIVTKETVIAKSAHDEVVLAENLLENLYRARAKAYAYGIIFEKYRDLVAVSMFYEYLSSGRCSALEGATGAYNLYESELRANIIISKLTEINEHLEEIKQNQFMLYEAINEVSNQLYQLNSSMDTMIQSLNVVSGHLIGIENNTAVIAYNTEVTAFYAKKNAELTNALGFLIALK